MASFEKWLEEVNEKYSKLTSKERNKMLDYLISKSEPAQFYHLSTQLNLLLKRDFITCLPRELSHHILTFLEPKLLLKCCSVCKGWNDIISSCNVRWQEACMNDGFISPNTAQIANYKTKWIDFQSVIQGLKDRSLLEEHMLQGHSDRIMAVYYHNGKLATGSDDRTVRLWDCASGECVKVLKTHTVAALKFDDCKIVTGSYDSTASMWDIETGDQIQRFIGHVAAVFCVDFNDTVLITGSADSTVRIWNISNGDLIKVLNNGQQTWILELKLICDSKDGNFVVFSRDNFKVYFWNGTYHFNIDLNSFSIDIINHNHYTSDKSLLPGLHSYDDKVYAANFCNENHRCDILELSISKCFQVKDCKLKRRYKYQGSKLIGYLGMNDCYDVLLVEKGWSQYCIDLMSIKSNECIVSIKFDNNLNVRPAAFTLGDTDLLNSVIKTGMFIFAAALKNNTVYKMRWKTNIKGK